ncbi:helix-turn-helix domain-containing protein [Bacillus sp. 165]|nr:RodZ domain-containing protein [Bacillus sp. 165]MBO9128893.1 helix-turn-helix domain-containing protein [Bacillus sp. 165]
MTELGNRLKEARVEKGFSLDELQEVTKIQKRYLIGIEEGNYKVLPGNFYVRAFIRQYAEALGLDPEEIFEEYKAEIPAAATAEVSQLSRVRRTQESVSGSTSKIMDYMPKVLLSLVAISVAVGIWLLFQSLTAGSEKAKEQPGTKIEAEVEKAENSPLDKEEKQEEVKQTEKETESEQKEEPPAPVQELKIVEKKGKYSTVEISNATSLVLEISSKGTSYVDIKNGKGKNFFAGILKSGEVQQQDLTSEDTIRLNIGRSSDVEVKINGQVLQFPQNPNDYVQQIITIKNLRTAQSST